MVEKVTYSDPPPPPPPAPPPAEPAFPPPPPPPPGDDGDDELPPRRRPRALALVVALLVLASGLGVGGYLLFSGGGDDGETGGAASPAAGGGCFKVEHPQDLGNAHLNAGESFDRYSSNPPTSGPHDPTPTEAGVIYKKPQPVEMLVHSMEHGAVVFWENGLSDQLESEAKDAVNAAYSEGYHSLIVTPYDGMDVPFAMTAWGTLQKCVGVDVQLIRSFVHRFYASGQEGALACQGESSTVPACQKTG